METILLTSSDKEKMKKALSYLKELGISYSKLKNEDLQILMKNEEFSEKFLRKIADKGRGLDFLKNEEELYTDSDLRVKY